MLSQIVHWGFYVDHDRHAADRLDHGLGQQDPDPDPALRAWSPGRTSPASAACAAAAKHMWHAIGHTGHEPLAWGFYGLFVLHVAGRAEAPAPRAGRPDPAAHGAGRGSGRWWEPRLLLIALARHRRHRLRQAGEAAASGQRARRRAEAAPAAPFLPEAPASPRRRRDLPLRPPTTPAAAAPAAIGAVAWKVAPGSSLNFETQLERRRRAGPVQQLEGRHPVRSRCPRQIEGQRHHRHDLGQDRRRAARRLAAGRPTGSTPRPTPRRSSPRRGSRRKARAPTSLTGLWTCAA